jgi:uncharacterized protein (TIGR03118 family)
MSSTSPFWVANNGSGTSTVYRSNPFSNALTVTIPHGGPTGVVFNNTGGGFAPLFGPAPVFLFADAGGISGWHPSNGTSAINLVNTAPGTFYSGLAVAGTGTGARLFAANFSGGTINAYDNTLTAFLGGFTDPNLPAGYSPFNIQNIGGSLFVAYALFDPSTGEEVVGAGKGIVNEFDINGNLVRRLVNPGGALNAPWGFAKAPSTWGVFANALLVGNFGDGTINAFDPTSGNFLGTLTDKNGTPIENEGLWGITFGNGGNGGDPNVLYFAAGIDDEEHGLMGSLSVTPEPSTVWLMATGLTGLFAGLRRRRRV